MGGGSSVNTLQMNWQRTQIIRIDWRRQKELQKGKLEIEKLTGSRSSDHPTQFQFPMVVSLKEQDNGSLLCMWRLGSHKEELPPPSLESAGRKLYPSLSTFTCKGDEVKCEVANVEECEANGGCGDACKQGMTSCISTANRGSCNDLSGAECTHVHVCTSQPIANAEQAVGSTGVCTGIAQ